MANQTSKSYRIVPLFFFLEALKVNYELAWSYFAFGILLIKMQFLRATRNKRHQWKLFHCLYAAWHRVAG